MNQMLPVPEIRKEKSEKNKARELEKMLKKEMTFGKSKIGITRKNKSLDKKAVKRAKLSRKINSKISDKKFRPTGSKKRR